MKFEIDPFEPPNSSEEKPIQDRFEAGRLAGLAALGQGLRRRLTQIRKHIPCIRFIRDLQSRYRIVKLPAITARDGLDMEVKAAVCPARDPGSITALRTFKPIRATHATTVFFCFAAKRTVPKAHKKGAPNRGASQFVKALINNVFLTLGTLFPTFPNGPAQELNRNRFLTAYDTVGLMDNNKYKILAPSNLQLDILAALCIVTVRGGKR